MAHSSAISSVWHGPLRDQRGASGETGAAPPAASHNARQQALASVTRADPSMPALSIDQTAARNRAAAPGSSSRPLPAAPALRSADRAKPGPGRRRAEPQRAHASRIAHRRGFSPATAGCGIYGEDTPAPSGVMDKRPGPISRQPTQFGSCRAGAAKPCAALRPYGKFLVFSFSIFLFPWFRSGQCGAVGVYV